MMNTKTSATLGKFNKRHFIIANRTYQRMRPCSDNDVRKQDDWSDLDKSASIREGTSAHSDLQHCDPAHGITTRIELPSKLLFLSWQAGIGSEDQQPLCSFQPVAQTLRKRLSPGPSRHHPLAPRQLQPHKTPSQHHQHIPKRQPGREHKGLPSALQRLLGSRRKCSRCCCKCQPSMTDTIGRKDDSAARTFLMCYSSSTSVPKPM